MTTQCEAILAHLKSGKDLTPLQAFDEFLVFRLAARIEELRSQGHDIKTQMLTQNGKTFARYTLRSSNY